MENQVAQAPDDRAAAYGLARALFRAGRFDEASQRLSALRGKSSPSPWVETLAAEIALARKDGAAAVRTLETATRSFPSSRSLVYALADARILAGEPGAAVEGVRSVLSGRQSDPRLWQLLSRGYAALGKRTAQHRAQAEVYLLRGSLPAAVEQLEIARKAGDGDFFDLSAVDARLRELKQRLIEQRRERYE